MKIIIVNEKDEIVGLKDRLDITSRDIYRVSALWLMNESNKILLARRSYTKNNDPGKWGPAVAGTVEENETYESNIIKETEEELGLTNLKIKKGPKQRIKGPHNHFTQWFFSLPLDKKKEDFKFDKEEIAEIRWFSKEELLNLIRDNPSEFTSSLRDINFVYSSLLNQKNNINLL